jgi:hypothetical protein
MARYAHNRDHSSPAIQQIQLNIWGEYPDYQWKYSTPAVIIGDNPAVIEIELQNKTNARAIITTYACTGVTAKHSPIISFAADNERNAPLAVLTIGLRAHEVIDFGLFVDLTNGEKGTRMTVFCDPQASNDPIKTPDSSPG